MATPTPSPSPAPSPAPSRGRDRFIDFVRAFSLLVVVAWHWVFTIIVWRPDGPHATNPIGFTRGLFFATWLLQVMPLFFFVGGFAHERAWLGRSDGRRTLGEFARDRAIDLARPALLLAGAWWLLGSIVVFLFELDGIGRAVTLILSPLWFLVVYLMLILLFPLAYRLHLRFGGLVIVWSIGLAALVDVIRFDRGVEWIAWCNMILVWGMCHQLGFFWEDLVAAGRRVGWMLAWGGLFGLAALVGSGLYPGSMVGVPGQKVSNMAPPTICIVALVFFQAGVALLIRPWVLDKLETSRRWEVTSSVINGFSLPLYLFHSTGMAMWAAVTHFVFDVDEVRRPDATWWLTRPVAFVGPLLFTLPIILLLARREPRPVVAEVASDPARG
jgi:hypothetical protein